MWQRQRATVQGRLAGAARSPAGRRRGVVRARPMSTEFAQVERGDPRRGGERGSPYGPAPGGQSGSVTQEILRAAVQSYQSVRPNEDWFSRRSPMLRAM